MMGLGFRDGFPVQALCLRSSKCSQIWTLVQTFPTQIIERSGQSTLDPQEYEAFAEGLGFRVSLDTLNIHLKPLLRLTARLALRLMI